MHNFDSLGYLKNEIFEKFTINNFSLLRDNLFFRNIKYNNIEILKLISFLFYKNNRISLIAKEYSSLYC